VRHRRTKNPGARRPHPSLQHSGAGFRSTNLLYLIHTPPCTHLYALWVLLVGSFLSPHRKTLTGRSVFSTHESISLVDGIPMVWRSLVES